MNLLDTEKILSFLRNRRLDFRMHYLETIDSTNTMAKELACQGASEGTVVLADSQWAGKGRQGRFWNSPPGRNLYISFVLRPLGWPGHPGLFAFIGALAVRDVLRDGYGINAALKWPNDVLVAGRKIAGILVERVGESQYGQALILGIGVNLNMTCGEFPDAIAERATSVSLELGHPVDRSAFGARLIDAVFERYAVHMEKGPGSVLESWRSCSSTLGRKVTVHLGKRRFSGEALDITDNGFLVLRTTDGHERIIPAGDVTV